MFDLRYSVRVACMAVNQYYVDKSVFDYESTARSLEQIEKAVFADAAVLIGDWTFETEHYTVGYNKVRNKIELLVCAKSVAAIDALDTIVSDFCTALNRNHFDSVVCLDSQVVQIGERKKAAGERVHYVTLTLEVLAFENATILNALPAGGATPPTVVLTAPSEGAIILIHTTSDPASYDLTVSANFTKGTNHLAFVHFLLTGVTDGHATIYDAQALAGDPTSGSVIFTIAANELADGLYYVKVFLMDNSGTYDLDTRTITITNATP